MLIEGVVKRCCIPYEQVARKGDTIAILADHGTDPAISSAFAAAAAALDMTPIVVTMPTSTHDYADPPQVVKAAAEAADVVHYVTSRYLVHSRWGRSLSRAGKRKVVSDGITFNMLHTGASEVDPDEIVYWNGLVASALAGASEVHLSSSRGTDLTIGIEGRPPVMGGAGGTRGLDADVELAAGLSAQFPGGECAVAPVEDTANGTVVIDKTLQPVPGLLAEPVVLTIEAGTITDIRGGDEAKWYRLWLERFADENGRRLAEFAIGTNPAARWSGNLRQDRFILGSSHLGFGMNLDVGGTIDSNIHYDAAMSMPTITVDGTVLVDEGNILTDSALASSVDKQGREKAT